MERMRARLLCVAGGFGVLFGAVSVKLALATVFHPMLPAPRQIAPQVPVLPKPNPGGLLVDDLGLVHVHRATITDRNGTILAISLPLSNIFANPLELMDPKSAAEKLKTILPALDMAETVKRLSEKKQFVYIARDVPPDKELAINDLGIPGIYFQPGERRRYPLGRVAAQIMGTVDIDDHGVAGVERYFNKRLMSSPQPLRLSIDVRVQSVVRDVMDAALDEFHAIGACGIVMDVRTGEILAMVSLPDFDVNNFDKASSTERFNRAVTGMYEPGSTFKLQTAAMALQDGVAHIWDKFSTSPIRVGRFTITDMRTDHFAPWLALPSVLAYSSNPAAAHIALDVGAKRQQDWLRNMGFFSKVPVQLPESGHPIVPSLRNWGRSTVMTVGFGHGIAESPLAIVRGTAATANGGILVTPTLLARPDPQADTPAGSSTPFQTVSATLPPSPSDVVPDGDAEVVPQGPTLALGAHLDDPTQDPAPGGHQGDRQERRRAGLLCRRQDRDGGKGRAGWALPQACERRRLHRCVSHEFTALRGLCDARQPGRQQGNAWLDHGRLGRGSRGRQDRRANWADARPVPRHREHGRDRRRVGDPARPATAGGIASARSGKRSG